MTKNQIYYKDDNGRLHYTDIQDSDGRPKNAREIYDEMKE